jgi:transposase
MASRTKIELTMEERSRLETLVTAPRTLNRHVWRARIVLLSAEGVGTLTSARRVGKSKRTVWRWQERFVTDEVDGLLCDKPRSGRPPTILPDQVRTVVETTLRQTPAEATHWSTRTLARVVGLGKTSIQKIWREHGLKPHLVKGFKVSRDPAFVDKVRDVVGLYINPPEHAIVLSVDEKSQIQALERTQQPLPLIPGHATTRTHDYARHDDPVHRPRHQDWAGSGAMLQAPPASGVHSLPGQDRPRNSGISGRPFDRRQLCDP